MRFREYSHRHADAIIANNPELKERYGLDDINKDDYKDEDNPSVKDRHRIGVKSRFEKQVIYPGLDDMCLVAHHLGQC